MKVFTVDKTYEKVLSITVQTDNCTTLTVLFWPTALTVQCSILPLSLLPVKDKELHYITNPLGKLIRISCESHVPLMGERGEFKLGQQEGGGKLNTFHFNGQNFSNIEFW